MYRDNWPVADLFRTSGGLTLEERRTTSRLVRLKVTETESHPFLTAMPAARADAFNRYVAKRFDLARGLFAAGPIDIGRHPEGETTYDRFYEIHYLNGRLISVEVYTHHESFFGHGWRSEFGLNWDAKRGRPMRVADLFRSGTDFRDAIAETVRAWAKENVSDAAVDDLVAMASPDDDESWLFDDNGGVLLIGRGERSMVGLSADVPIPYTVLAPFLVPDAPLPKPDD
jgi:hypothetical protein